MALKITDACLACGACAAQCPVEAISEGDIYKIDPEVCVRCGLCISSCKFGAISKDQ